MLQGDVSINHSFPWQLYFITVSLPANPSQLLLLLFLLWLFSQPLCFQLYLTCPCPFKYHSPGRIGDQSFDRS